MQVIVAGFLMRTTEDMNVVTLGVKAEKKSVIIILCKTCWL